MSIAINSPIKMISSTSSTPDNSTVESPGINHDPNFMLQLQRSTSQSQLNPGHPSLLNPLQINHNNHSQNTNTMHSPGSESFESEDEDDSDIAEGEDEEYRKRREAMYRRPSFKLVITSINIHSSI
ncbi:hypothetical protein LOD99_11606 [Oopsacas minuta]|uniref:Uncharacterized protein n=1 Tax=Oopsacas minuta TaxID=111878 RepID=A0AAV7JLE5_9METZ|nr:hypothetical protein LOD99_11606 [Oopsacas minuta]